MNELVTNSDDSIVEDEIEEAYGDEPVVIHTI